MIGQMMDAPVIACIGRVRDDTASAHGAPVSVLEDRA